MKVFIWRDDRQQFIEVEGQEVVIPGFEQYKFYATPHQPNPKEYAITEAQSGYYIECGETVEKAIANTKAHLMGTVYKIIEERVAIAVRANGISPMFKHPEQPTL